MGIIRTSGKWTAVRPSPNGITGVGTEHVEWGDPTESRKSGYRFTGGETQALLNGTEFTLATFTHENFPINSGNMREWDVELQVNVAFEDGKTKDFTFTFHHNETDNSGAHPEDIVSLPEFISPETVTVDGQPYKVMLSGFKRGGQIVRQFDSPENGSNRADIVAVFAKPGKPDVAITRVEAEGTVPGTQADEYVEVFNRGTEAADMSGWTLRARNSGKQFTFPAGTALKPGSRYRVHTNERHPETGGFSFGSSEPVWDDVADVAVLSDDKGKQVSRFRYGQVITPEPAEEMEGAGEAHPRVVVKNNDKQALGRQKVVISLPENGPIRFHAGQNTLALWNVRHNREDKFTGAVSADGRTLTVDVDLDIPLGRTQPMWVQVSVDPGAPSGSYTIHWELGELGSANSTLRVK
ncbi:lamin tail domain-containing protein [Streptomyces sp. ISL-22]|uniref:lamin tail domain-containing protein n=1 Tax=Streptomyces TaxID=1883 RepID=UPI0007C8326B|nr:MULTISPECIES: lamin tail domain-containing protein [Streptomyces]MBT2420314.1 lamin tail domain-containing protein [Streptomyces sp. ISL-24]MBT2433072.1 lamin tail domain-containing protein [Streptomyces sp. ISL-22]